MKPIQVYLEDGDFGRLEAWARENHMTKSEALRLAVRALTRRRGGDDPVLSLSGVLEDDLPANVAERFDDYLQETFVGESAAEYGRRRRPRARR